MSAAWFSQAACKDMPTDLFFPQQEEGNGDVRRAAKAVCKACPVRKDCLHHALTNHIDDGIWGGMAERERTRLRRNIQRPVPCSFCEKPFRSERPERPKVWALDFCSIECQRAYTNERKNASRRLRKLESECSEDGCDEPVQGRGMCNKHYKRWYKAAYPEQYAKELARRAERKRERRHQVAS